MILTGAKIREEVVAGNIIISPFSDEQINPNSYNYRLGSSLKVPAEGVILDPAGRQTYKEFIVPEEGLVLVPGILYLGHTEEIIGSTVFVTSLIGRSSLGRLGLYLQVSADLGHVGAVHKWTLELTVVQPLRIYPQMVVGQVSFWTVEGEVELYSGSHANRGIDGPLESQSFLTWGQ